MKEITIQPFQSLSIDQLEDLYKNVDQSFCLVQLPIPLPRQQANMYLEAIEKGVVNEKPFLSYAIGMENQIIGKIEITRHEDGSGEIDIVIQQEYTNQRIGHIAIRQFIDIVKEKQFCHTIKAYINKENQIAIQCFSNVGFHIIQTFKADIMVPKEGIYQFKTITGYELTRDL